MHSSKRVACAMGTLGILFAGASGKAASVFDAAVETFAQSQANGPWSAALAIDGSTDGAYDGTKANGWAILASSGSDPTPTPQSAYFRFTTPLQTSATSPDIQIQLYQLFNPTSSSLNTNPFHTLGAFRLSVTGTDLHTSPFTLSTASAATWTALAPDSFVIAPVPPGTPPTFSVDGSDDIFVNPPGPAEAVYTLTAKPGFSTITGVRLEVLTDPALPFNGPGFSPTNGNFVLNEITAQAAAVPEAATISALALGSALLLGRRRARR